MVRRQPPEAMQGQAVPSSRESVEITRGARATGSQQQRRPGAAKDAVEREDGRQRLEIDAIQGADEGGAGSGAPRSDARRRRLPRPSRR